MSKFRLRVLFSMFLVVALVAMLAAGCSPTDEGDNGEGQAEDKWPEHEIRLIVNYAAGGGADTSARQLQPYLEKYLGVPVVIDNREGGNGVIGATMLKESKGDGYTLGVMTAPHLEFSIVTMDAPYTLDDFDFVGVHVADPGMIRIHKDETRFSTFEELLAYAKDHPGEVKFSVSSVTSSNYLGLKVIEEAAGVEFNIVNFDGGNPARVALAGRHVDGTHAGVFNSQHIAEDTKCIAVHYNENKWPDITDNAPTVNEVLGTTTIDTGSFYFMFAPATLKQNYPERFEKICDAYEQALNDPEFIQAMKDAGEYEKWIYMDHETAEQWFSDNVKAFESMKKYFE